MKTLTVKGLIRQLNAMLETPLANDENEPIVIETPAGLMPITVLHYWSEYAPGLVLANIQTSRSIDGDLLEGLPSEDWVKIDKKSMKLRRK